MAGFVNTCVFSTLNKRALLPWTVIEIPEPEYTFQDFFKNAVWPRIAGPSTINYELLSTHVGPQKHSLDPVDSHLRVVPQ